MINKNKIFITFIIILFVLLSISCEWPFNTKPTENDVFGLTVNHNITRLMPSAEINLIWNEITVEQFAMYKIERMRTQDTLWTSIVDLSDAFQLSYTDTIWDDDDLIYRVGIFDTEENVKWATASISIPKTTLVLVPDEFEKIQPAFNSGLIDDGDTIIVNPGIYKETLGIAGKNVLIKSREGYQTTKLRPSYTDDPNNSKRVMFISSGVLQGFTVERGAPSHGAPGGGINIAQTGTVKNCYINGNQSQGEGGGVFLTNDGSLYNNIINNNIAEIGSGITVSSAHGEIINNTIVGNDVVIKGDCCGLVIRNNIIYTGLSFMNQSSKTDVIIDYSLLQNSLAIGFENITGYPLFENSVNFHLSPASPCIDAGHPDKQYRDTDGSRNDIGVYGGPGSE